MVHEGHSSRGPSVQHWEDERVSTPLVAAATVVALVVAVLGGLSTVLRRRTGLAHLVAAGVLEAILLVQLALVLVDLAGGQRPPETATFLAYLVSVVLVPVAGVLWSRTEPTRWAGTVLAVAALVVSVMVWRLLQLWEATGA
jgi:predicted neutral ceramidase superfamily lipid hydrolase